MTEPTELIREARARHSAAADAAKDRSPMAYAQMMLVAGFVPELADALETTLAERDEARRDMDARWEHSPHLAAKYYQRMRNAKRTLTEHCAVVCQNPKHDAAKATWHEVEMAYFESRRIEQNSEGNET